MLSHPPTTQTTMLCSTTSSEHYMPLDYTKPAPNPTSNSPNVGLPCPPPTAHHCYRAPGTIQLSSQLQWLSSKCEVGSVSFILPLHLRAPRPGKRGKFTPQWNVSKLRFQSSQTFQASTSAAVLMQLCGFWAKREKFREKNVSESSHSNAKIFHFRSIYFPRLIIFERAGSFFHVFWNISITSGFPSKL